MTYVTWARPDITIANKATFFAGNGGTFPGLWQLLSDAGWTLHDNQDGSNYRVYYSDGELANVPRFYVQFETDSHATHVKFKIYRYWDNSSHVGHSKLYIDPQLQTSESGFNSFIYLDKDIICMTNVIGTIGYNVFFGNVQGRFSHSDVTTTLSSGAGSGASVNLSVADSANFEVGKKYQILNNNPTSTSHEDTEFFTCTGVAAGQITADNLTNSYDSGAVVGICPRAVFARHTTHNTYFLEYTGDTGDSSSNRNGDHNGALPISEEFLFQSDLQNRIEIDYPIYFANDVSPPIEYPVLLIGSLNSNWKLTVGGHSSDIPFLGLGLINVSENGTSSGSNTATTLNDTSKAWTVDALAGLKIYVSNGTGQGQLRTILSNTATQITISEDWDVSPDGSSEYSICDSAKRCLPISANQSVSGSSTDLCFFLVDPGP